ncbi:MAG: hypothetical protein U9O49_02640 [Candidatus Thermoplasmatota archaeon]|nr:hypothetical protein [Candidatus Thermoplasmatota archaeon]
MQRVKQKLLVLVIFLFFFQFLVAPALAEAEIDFQFYYSHFCGSCHGKKLMVDDIIDIYNESNEITFEIKDIAINDTYKKEYYEWKQNYSVYYPFIVMRNETNMTFITYYEMTFEKINDTVKAFLAGVEADDNDENLIYTPFGTINVSGLSLPILAIVLGGIDSFNPCAFFILIFLLNLLIYARSRKRMLLVGGIFIFFSGLLYILFMFIMYETFIHLQTAENVTILTMIAGAIVLPMGILNIKDFFFFKKGASLSIPDSKKPKLYKQMRNLVKNPKLGATLIGTIVLAATVNFYELLCTLGLPFAFIDQLSKYSLSPDSSPTSYYIYIFLYNVVYVIPLIIIVCIFAYTLGRRKLTEWHGQIMKLEAGIMLSCFGALFLYDYQLLENPITPILLLLFSILLTVIISKIWKKRIEIREEKE